MATAVTERGAADYIFTDKAVPQQVFNAEIMRIDSSAAELKTAIDKLDKKVDKGFSYVNARFDKMGKSIDERFDKVYAHFDKMKKDVDERFEKMESKFDGLRQDFHSSFRWLITTQIAFTLLILGVVYNMFVK